MSTLDRTFSCKPQTGAGEASANCKPQTANCKPATRILAPLRGVTIRAFRTVFADEIRQAGFDFSIAPFIPANPGLKVRDQYLKDILPFEENLTPQIISRDPDAMRILMRAMKDKGYTTCDLNAGCPFPMIVRRGRGSGLFKTPDVLERLVAAGCEEMGPGNFSVKTRLGLASPDELEGLIEIYNRYPLRFLTVHARTAKQMYDGACDLERLARIEALSKNPVVWNGDLAVDDARARTMIGRSFVRSLGAREDSRELLRRYAAFSAQELSGSGDAPVLGRLKELLSYWAAGSKYWARKWNTIKICRTLHELDSALPDF